MQAGEFFVKLFVKGGDQAKQSVEGVSDKVKGLGSNITWARAGLVGMMWGLQKMMAGSNDAGASLVNFSASTGLSMKRLQEWQYAAQQVNVEAGSVTSSVKGIQSSMMNMLQGGGAPKGLAMFADYMAKIGTPIDMKKVLDVDYMIDGLQKFSQSADPALLKDKIMSFGVDEAMFTAMRRNAFRPDVYAKAPKYSEGDAKSLDKMKSQWSNIGQNIEMSLGKMFAKHTPKLVSDIERIVPQILKLADAMMTLIDKTKVIGLLGKSFDGWEKIISGLAGEADAMGKGKDGPISGFFKDIFNATGLYDSDKDTEKYVGYGKSFMSKVKKNPALPSSAGATAGKAGAGNTTNITQTLEFKHDGKDAQKTGDSVHRATKNAISQSSALKQGS